VTAAGGEAVAIEVDVTDAAACGRMVAATRQRFGTLTTLVNSAGVASTLGHTPPAAEWRRVVEVNLTGTWLAARGARGAHRQRRGLDHSVCPGHVETPLTASFMADPTWRASMLKRYPLERFGRVDDGAAAILYLASDEAFFITGVALPVDGGYTAV
jgi:NAD(P)-dependent dehydrogenase (short-subunit alcohol dehydrogenase family)